MQVQSDGLRHIREGVVTLIRYVVTALAVFVVLTLAVPTVAEAGGRSQRNRQPTLSATVALPTNWGYFVVRIHPSGGSVQLYPYGAHPGYYPQHQPYPQRGYYSRPAVVSVILPTQWGPYVLNVPVSVLAGWCSQYYAGYGAQPGFYTQYQGHPQWGYPQPQVVSVVLPTARGPLHLNVPVSVLAVWCSQHFPRYGAYPGYFPPYNGFPQPGYPPPGYGTYPDPTYRPQHKPAYYPSYQRAKTKKDRRRDSRDWRYRQAKNNRDDDDDD